MLGNVNFQGGLSQHSSVFFPAPHLKPELRWSLAQNGTTVEVCVIQRNPSGVHENPNLLVQKGAQQKGDTDRS